MDLSPMSACLPALHADNHFDRFYIIVHGYFIDWVHKCEPLPCSQWRCWWWGNCAYQSIWPNKSANSLVIGHLIYVEITINFWFDNCENAFRSLDHFLSPPQFLQFATFLFVCWFVVALTFLGAYVFQYAQNIMNKLKVVLLFSIDVIWSLVWHLSIWSMSIEHPFRL